MDDQPPALPDAELTPLAPAPRTSRTSRPWLIALLSAAIVIALVLLVAPRARLYDPYRPGTTHRASTTLNGCNRPGGLHLDGDPDSRWASHDAIPDGWPQLTPTGTRSETLTGTLEVTAVGRGTFTADQGGSVTFVQLGANQFDDLSCPVK